MPLSWNRRPLVSMPRLGLALGLAVVGLVAAGSLAAAPANAAEVAPPALATYGALPAWSDAAVSPSGKFVAVLGTEGGQRVVFLLTSQRELVARLPAGTTKLRGITWAGDDFVLIDYTNTAKLGPEFALDKVELGTTMVVPLHGGQPHALFDKDGTVSGGVWGNYGVARHDGRWYAYVGGITLVQLSHGARALPLLLVPDLYEVDLATNQHHLLAPCVNDGHVHRDWLIDDHGQVAVIFDVWDTNGRWQLRTPHNVVLAEGHDRLGRVDMLGFTPDGTGVVYSQRDADNLTRWYQVPLAGGASTLLLPDTTIKSSLWSRDRRLLGTLSDNGTDSNTPGTASDGHFFDAHHNQVYAAARKAFPGARVSLVSASDDFNHLALNVSGPQDPETLWLVDIASGKADPLVAGYALAPAAVGPMRMVKFTAADGLGMEGLLTLPPGRPAKALPAVILPHGGPASHDQFGFDWWAQAYASRGYAVFQPNFRGSNGYGTTFEDAGHGEWGRKMQTDLSDGLAELVRQGIVDPKRVCIVGASYGGYAALAGVTLQHGIYACAVSVAGIGDLQRMVENDKMVSGDSDVTVHALRAELGKGSDIKAVSPIRFAGSVTVPVLLIHGKDDTVVPYHQSKLMADALREAGKQVEFVTLPGEDHWLSQSATRQQMLEAAVGFVMRAVPPDPVLSLPH